MPNSPVFALGCLLQFAHLWAQLKDADKSADYKKEFGGRLLMHLNVVCPFMGALKSRRIRC